MLALTGCGSADSADGSAASSGSSASPSTGSSTEASTNASPAPSLAPMASPVMDAVTLTRALGTAGVTVKSASQVGTDEPWVNSGTGELDLAKGLGRIDFDSSRGGTSALLVNQDGAFVSPDRGTTWFLLGFGQTTPLMGSINVFRILDRIDWSTGQPDTVDGAALTRYDGSMVDPTIADAVDGMGVSTERPELLAQLSDLTIDGSVWIDADGRIVRILRDVQAQTPDGPLTATQLATLDDFRRAVDLASPPDDRVQVAPEG